MSHVRSIVGVHHNTGTTVIGTLMGNANNSVSLVSVDSDGNTNGTSSDIDVAGSLGLAKGGLGNALGAFTRPTNGANASISLFA